MVYISVQMLYKLQISIWPLRAASFYHSKTLENVILTTYVDNNVFHDRNRDLPPPLTLVRDVKMTSRALSKMRFRGQSIITPSLVYLQANTAG